MLSYDRRKSKRIPVRLPVRIKGSAEMPEVEGEITDLSEKGAAVRSPLPVGNEGDPILLEIIFDEPIILDGIVKNTDEIEHDFNNSCSYEIRWRGKSPTGQIGVQFTSLEKDHQLLLRKIIDYFKAMGE